jgi:hypothetical protein
MPDAAQYHNLASSAIAKRQHATSLGTQQALICTFDNDQLWTLKLKSAHRMHSFSLLCRREGLLLREQKVCRRQFDLNSGEPVCLWEVAYYPNMRVSMDHYSTPTCNWYTKNAITTSPRVLFLMKMPQILLHPWNVCSRLSWS